MTGRIRKTADERKAEIVAAAIRLAGDIGPDRITTQMLAREVGISQPGIFRHFPTKDDIWWAVAREIGGMVGQTARLPADEEILVADHLRKIVAGHLGFLAKTPAIQAILFSRELHSENEKMRAFFADLIASRHQHFSALIAAGISKNQFRKTLDADDAAYLILALIQGLTMRWSLNARSFDLVAEGRRLLDLQLSGFE